MAVSTIKVDHSQELTTEPEGSLTDVLAIGSPIIAPFWRSVAIPVIKDELRDIP